ncbi:MAG: 1,4-dihydroxy-2-naphthoate octaprenyltransferase, partial [Flavobacteriales bacterium]
LGILAIIAAIKYTIGKKAYGYSGLGDLFVFIFFGLIGNIGTFFLQSHSFKWTVLLPATGLGFLITGVLNLNNMRDRKGDKLSGKNTLAVFLNEQGIKTYHFFLLFAGFIALILFSAIEFHSFYQYIFILAVPLLIRNIYIVFKNKEPAYLDKELKIYALSVFLIAVLFSVGLAVVS